MADAAPATVDDVIPAQECVRVVVRVRPTNDRERKLQASDDTVVAIRPAADAADLPTKLHVESKPHEIDANYTYDAVFGTAATQRDVYSYVQSSVEQVVQGFNCTIFAYGQTGTGKTHTMMGPDSSLRQGDMSQWGVIPRAVDGLFQELKSVGTSGAGAFVHCSYMQIYNNQVFDLLQSRMKDQQPLQVREMIKGHAKHIYVSGISEFRVGNAQEVLDLLTLGSKNRTIRATECNEKSSRSHALLQLSMEVESRGNERTTIIRRAKLNLVDLAGSEKWDTEVAMTQDRTRELRNINASLSALGNVISALTDRKRTHIPYRDSKLTRLLQDSLGGNTRTIVIATISPSQAAVEETVSTLQFAERAKQIALNVQVNEVVDDAVLLARAQREIQKLKLQLKTEQPNVAAMNQRIQGLEAQIEALREENRLLKMQLVSNQTHNPEKPTIGSVPSNPRTAPPTATTADRPEDERVATAPTGSTPTDERRLSGSQSKNSTTSGSTRSSSKHRLAVLTSPETSTNQQDDVTPDWERQTQPFLQQLEVIQTERRGLEAQLEALKFTHVPEEDDVCPMCHHVIDHHTDTELDRCIELEQQVHQQRHHSIGSNSSTSASSSTNTTDAASAPKPAGELAALPAIKSVKSTTATILDPSPYNMDQLISRGSISSRGSAKSVLSPVAPAKPKPKRSATVKLLKAKTKQHLAKSPYHDVKKDDKDAPKPLAALGTGLHNDVRDIGLTISVYTYRYDCWYPCTIVGYDSKRKMHCCLYDYGDKQWTVLRDKKFQVVGRSNESSPPRGRNQPPSPRA
ncbi:Aste57867_11399 [Aphanomyces stellatus]|uniref:Kinesin-like protein n=1 Tax=Aphanomyces stellatus TaxID=120398 RepID=A0A485KUR2_9STRA|nr:hypothetical protein As57867_011357 [Aphanomyces stellatus]VFT88260.1 Aste57867_11399 [Aphanomyces stellatus]